jgi:tetratricopeptide (TPR) repeat protein
MRLASNESILYIGGSAGLGFVARLFERLSVGVSGYAGLGKVPYGDDLLGLYELGARLETSFRLSAAMTIGLSAGYENLANPNTGSFMDAISAGIRLKLTPAEARSDRVNLAFEKVQTQAIFPVFRSWYDSEPLGSVRIRNDEDGPIENIRVSFFAPEYMGGPRLCTTVKKLARGQSVEVPLYAVFDERVLTLTENGSTSAHIDVAYSFLGSKRDASESLTLSLHHRNAMSWEDDRRAAAFVSPTDPAALWFSRYASSIVRDRMRTELPPNMQFALGIFEALKLYGLNYVIDPNSAYITMSENEAVIDYLQYPSQTLMYRGGDCDDLSILFCSLLESSGINTAFITIPGHIFMAFDMGLSEAEARERFFDPGLLLFRDGRAWAPVEITMVKDGFVKAWRVGAKQWIDNERIGSSAFYPMKENWARYKPSGLQDAAARFTLPDEASAMAAFDSGIDRFVAREVEPIVADYERQLAKKRTPEILNEYGMAMARVGMLDPAWERFVEASKTGYAWSWNNLASIAFIRKDFALAYSYYQWTTTLIPGDPVAILGMARCAYELDRYSESAILYEGLLAEAPDLALKYGYLASAYGGAGRAWSMADRLANSIWSKPGLSFRESVIITQPSLAEAPPPPEKLEQPAPIAPVATIVTPAEPLVAAPEAHEVVEAKVDPTDTAIITEPAPIPLIESIQEEEPLLAIVEAPKQEAKTEPAIVTPAPPAPAVVAKAEPAVVAPKPIVAPTISVVAPADAEITAKIAEAAATPAIEPPPVMAPPAPAVVAKTEPAVVAPPPPTPIVAPPTISAVAPADAEIAAKIAEAAATPAIEPPPVMAPPAPAVVATTEPTDVAPAPTKQETRTLASAPVTVTTASWNLEDPSIRTSNGSWERSGPMATMTDPKAMFAKLIIPTPELAGPSNYEFKARSNGVDWVGFGMHIHGRGQWRLSGYGGGDSILVWITSDSKAYGDSDPRLQVYRSKGDVAMQMVASARIAGSVFDLHSYAVVYDPASGKLIVLVDGEPKLTVAGLQNPLPVDFIALRALDLAEFSNIIITPLLNSQASEETTP